MLVDCLNIVELDWEGKEYGRLERSIGDAHFMIDAPLVVADVVAYSGYMEDFFVNHNRDILFPDSREFDSNDELTLALVDLNRWPPRSRAGAGYRPNADDQ